MHTETIVGLHRCQPKNEPQPGQVKTFLIIHNPAKQGKKPWIAIKSAAEDKGGTPYKVVSVTPTGWEPDQYQNVSYNLEIEAANGAFQQAKAAMEQGEPEGYRGEGLPDMPPNAPQAPPVRSNGGDGVTEARKHLMKAANLYNLCIAAVDKAIAGNLPVVAQTPEQFQATLASLWIEASSRRSTDNKTWWSYIDLMPDTPLNKAKPQPEEESPF